MRCVSCNDSCVPEGQPCCESKASVVISLHTPLCIRKEHSWITEGDDFMKAVEQQKVY